jgi:hypothetical protein
MDLSSSRSTVRNRVRANAKNGFSAWSIESFEWVEWNRQVLFEWMTSLFVLGTIDTSIIYPIEDGFTSRVCSFVR